MMRDGNNQAGRGRLGRREASLAAVRPGGDVRLTFGLRNTWPPESSSQFRLVFSPTCLCVGSECQIQCYSLLSAERSTQVSAKVEQIPPAQEVRVFSPIFPPAPDKRRPDRSLEGRSTPSQSNCRMAAYSWQRAVSAAITRRAVCSDGATAGIRDLNDRPSELMHDNPASMATRGVIPESYCMSITSS
jgi:hypothetical protein